MKNYYLEKLYQKYLLKPIEIGRPMFYSEKRDEVVINKQVFKGRFNYTHKTFEDFEVLYNERKEELLIFLS